MADSGAPAQKQLLQEIESRPMRARKLDVVEYKGQADVANRPLVPPGTVTFFLARAGSALLTRIREAAQQGRALEQDLSALVYEQYEGRKPVSAAEAVAKISAQPVIAEIRYGGSTLITGAAVADGQELAVTAVPYNGGRFAREGFSLVERYKEGTSHKLEGFILASSPPLTEAEKAALQQVPEDQLELNVGQVHAEALPFIATMMVVAETAVFAVAYTKTAWGRFSQSEEHISDAELQNLGPGASARKLLAIRRKILEGRE
jgi:hypothetical protein